MEKLKMVERIPSGHEAPESFRARVFAEATTPGGDLEAAETALRSLDTGIKHVVHCRGPSEIPVGATIQIGVGNLAPYGRFAYVLGLYGEEGAPDTPPDGALWGVRPNTIRWPDADISMLSATLVLVRNTSLVSRAKDTWYLLPRPETKWTEDRWNPTAPVLHCATGPSVRYPDGSTLYHWRGQRVPKAWIRGEGPSVEDALQHKNAELRRCAAEILGWGAVLDRVGARVVDAHSNPEVGTLLEATLPHASAPQRFLHVRCGTGREFVLPVPQTMRTAMEANAWTYGFDDPEDFEVPGLRT